MPTDSNFQVFFVSSEVFVPLENFQLLGDIIITGEGLRI